MTNLQVFVYIQLHSGFYFMPRGKEQSIPSQPLLGSQLVPVWGWLLLDLGHHLMECQRLQGKTEGSEIKWQPHLCSLSTQNFDQLTANAVRTNLLWFTSQQGLFTPNCESLFPHHTFQWFCPKNSKGVALTVSVEAQHIEQSNRTHPPPPHPRSSRCTGRRTFGSKVSVKSYRGEQSQQHWKHQCNQCENSPQSITSLNSCYCPLSCSVHTEVTSPACCLPA